MKMNKISEGVFEMRVGEEIFEVTNRSQFSLALAERTPLSLQFEDETRCGMVWDNPDAMLNYLEAELREPIGERDRLFLLHSIASGK